MKSYPTLSDQLLRQKLEELQTKEDLLRLINEVLEDNFYRYTRLKVTMKQLSYYASSYTAADKQRNRYHTFFIRKKSGSARKILAPQHTLKYIQFALNKVLQATFEPQAQAFGFVRGKNIVDNAALHAGRNYVLNLDLKDFFPSVYFRRIKVMLEQPPFNLSSHREPLAYLIANLCTDEGVLPQGAPTSPVLTNIICQRLDRKLAEIAAQHSAVYSRYADDITFSSNDFVYSTRFRQRIERVIARERFVINESKTRLQEKGYRQEVTGLTVNEGVNPGRKYRKSYRTLLYLYKTKGRDAALDYFSKRLPQHMKKSHMVNIEQVIEGKYQFMKLVLKEKAPLHPFGKTGKTKRFPIYDTDEDHRLKMVWKKRQNVEDLVEEEEALQKEIENINLHLNELKAANLAVPLSSSSGPSLVLDDILQTWENEGFEKAMEVLTGKK